MSVVLSLTSAAIIACASVASVAVLHIAESKTGNAEETCFDTIFADCDLLEKTLQEHGCCVNKLSENEMTVETGCGILRYYRENVSLPFQLSLGEVSNPEALLEEMRLFEVEYGRNVQSYTYHHIKQNLSDDMAIIGEEVLEDDSLVLTISI